VNRRTILKVAGIAVLAAAGCAPGRAARAQEPRAIGGCRTVEVRYGLSAWGDSAAVRALQELIAPGAGERVGPACRDLGVDAPLFARVGAVDPPADTLWAHAVRRVGEIMDSSGLRLASRSLLRHTTGTCFPPYHVDLEAVGDTAQVRGFLERLSTARWDPWVVAPERRERRLMVTAGMGLQSMDTVVDLRLP
jgi:hypothetical protein